MPDEGSRSGAKIREALGRGDSVSWRFNSRQKRLRFALPKALGGRTYDVCLVGGYTFRGLVGAPHGV
jgi:hypothetical protein